MNKDIKVMIELQRYWDNVLRGRNDIEKSEKSILHWKKQVDEKAKELSQIEEKIKETKVIIKQKEIELSENDEQIKKLNKRRDIVKNEKEMTAIDHEFANVKSLKDNLESELINLFDFLGDKESEVVKLKTELNEVEKQSLKDITDLKGKISHFNSLIDENQQHFDESINNMSPETKMRFLKLIKSQNGKAIAMIEGEICGVCNFQIPFNIIQDVLKDNNIVNCTNCGRFLYIT